MHQSPIYVLIVDDDPGVRHLLAATFARLFPSLCVSTAATLQAATAALDRQTVDLLITDLRLADHTGLELAAYARESGHSMPILLITGIDHIDDDIWTSGITAALTKPFHLADFRALVRALLPSDSLPPALAPAVMAIST